MVELKRISMAGADIAVTDARVADLVLEYAMHLGRAGTTDTVVLPVARNGQQEQASLLIGPASQIALMENDDRKAEKVELTGIDELLADLRRRLDALLGRGAQAIATEADPRPDHDDFDAYSD
ncbi:MAG TPA: hypothetical protein VIG76_06195 [Amnibacterium sp.]|uniref:hypothetical protein n=1 Tax=Amnibacterium sp. TaxID=1872496 RepID=UPI002F937D34